MRFIIHTDTYLGISLRHSKVYKISSLALIIHLVAPSVYTQNIFDIPRRSFSGCCVRACRLVPWNTTWNLNFEWAKCVAHARIPLHAATFKSRQARPTFRRATPRGLRPPKCAGNIMYVSASSRTRLAPIDNLTCVARVQVPDQQPPAPCSAQCASNTLIHQSETPSPDVTFK